MQPSPIIDWSEYLLDAKMKIQEAEKHLAMHENEAGQQALADAIWSLDRAILRVDTA